MTAFLDEVMIRVRGGAGGHGCSSFRREKFVAKGGPDGGDGGHGGSVVLEATHGLNTLSHLRNGALIRADHGRNGEGSNKTGRGGEDAIVPVALGTIIRDGETGELLGDLKGEGERLVVASGGRGGRGNSRFKSSTNRAPRRADPGEIGVECTLRLELRLLADVGLVGLPNAGKSTLISRLSAARPKIAGYPFTTLVPNLGVVHLGEYRTCVMADIPGLIEGAHEGQGLGDKFLRHIRRTRCLLHLVDVSNPDGDPVQEYLTIRAELGAHSDSLLERPECIVATKLDSVDQHSFEKLRDWSKENGKTFLGISSVAGEGLNEILRWISAALESAPKELDAEGDEL